MLTKLIFIKQSKSLICEINPTEECIKFNNSILTALSNIDEGILPIKITSERKESVTTLLRVNYSKSDQVKGLINFLEKMAENEYLYICPYDEKYDELYDIYRESLSLYNKNFIDEHILEYMTRYYEMKNNTQKFLDNNPYNINIFVPQKKKKYLGESNKSNRECIYCNGNMYDKTASFKSKAHAMPESIGNKTYIQNEECDACNKIFAETIEEDLSIYFVLERLMFGIRGKNGLPVFQFGTKYVRYIDTESEDFNKEWEKFEVAKQLLKIQKPFKGGLIIGQDTIDKTKNLKIEYIEKYTPQKVYKAMVKSVIGVIDRSLLSEFKQTIQWLKNEVCVDKLPPVIIYESDKVYTEPGLYVFIRKSEDITLPFCYGELRLGKKIHIFALPLSIKDSNAFIKTEEFPIFINYIIQMTGQPNSILDLSSCDEVTVDIPLQFKKEIQIPTSLK